MFGDGVKRPAGSEATTRLNNRKSIVLVGAVRAGEPLTASHLAIKRPGTGIPPKHLPEIPGRVARRDLAADDVLSWQDIE